MCDKARNHKLANGGHVSHVIKGEGENAGETKGGTREKDTSAELKGKLRRPDANWSETKKVAVDENELE